MQENLLTALPMEDDPVDLIAAARRGDRDAFGVLARGCERMLYRVSRTVLHNDEDCADAVQEALTRAWLKLGNLKEPAYFRTWLIRILLNECYKQLRRGKRAASPPELEPWRPAGPERDELIDLEAALWSLPVRYRTALALHYVEDLNVAETARALRLPEGTVKTRLRRARAKLAAALREKEDQP